MFSSPSLTSDHVLIARLGNQSLWTTTAEHYMSSDVYCTGNRCIWMCLGLDTLSGIALQHGSGRQRKFQELVLSASRSEVLLTAAYSPRAVYPPTPSRYKRFLRWPTVLV